MINKLGYFTVQKSLKFLMSMCAGILLSANVWAAPFSSLYVFGDSLSDVGSNPAAVLSVFKLLGGNCDPGHPCPPYVDGHISNGPTAAEYLANSILPGGGTPANFHSFAVGGSTSGIGNYGDGGNASTPGAHGLPGMAQQLGLYSSLLASAGTTADPNALYFVWGGANDFLTDFLPDPSTPAAPITAAQNIASYVGALAGLGAEHILVPNLPDLSLTPFVKSLGPLSSTGHTFSMAFNTTLATLLDSLDQSLSADIIQFDTFSLFNNVVANPGMFGFTNASEACLLSVCTDANEFVFWDDFHPTTHAHAVIASAFANAVPEPNSIMLLAIGLLVLAVVSARRERGRVMYRTNKI